MAKIANLFMTAGFAVAVVAPGPLGAKSNKHREPPPGAGHQPHVACTVLGCQTIPAACHPKEERHVERHSDPFRSNYLSARSVAVLTLTTAKTPSLMTPRGLTWP
jgi:hypothetical protein